MPGMIRPALVMISLLSLTACQKREADPSHATHSGHAHSAPHGGMLVELGEHAYNLEFVRDAAAGKLTVYVLDGHAENFVRLKAGSIGFVATFGADLRLLTLQAVANAATGETVGDTSQFEASAEWLKAAAGIEGTIPAIEIRGTKFENIAVRLPGRG